jgi:hypothetical protein
LPLAVDCHAFVLQCEESDRELAAKDPKLANPDRILAWVRDNQPITVYKRGAASEWTSGNLTWIKELKQRIQTSLVRFGM